MVVAVSGSPLPWSACESPSALFALRPELLERARRVAAAKPRTVRPEGVLYARQKVNPPGNRG